MTSTLAVYEPFVAKRPTKDARTLDAMAPELRETFSRCATRSTRPARGRSRSGPAERDGVREGVRRGGWAAGGGRRSDRLRRRAGRIRRPAQLRAPRRGRLHARAGGADHDRERREDPRRRQALGSVERGKLADLVVLKGDLTADPAVIRNPTSCSRMASATIREADRLGQGTGRNRLGDSTLPPGHDAFRMTTTACVAPSSTSGISRPSQRHAVQRDLGLGPRPVPAPP